MPNDKEQVPPHIAAGQLFKQIEQLPGDQRDLMFAADQKTRERIMKLDGDARAAAIDALRPKPDVPAETPKKGE